MNPIPENPLSLEHLAERVGAEHFRKRIALENSVFKKVTFGYWDIPLSVTEKIFDTLMRLLKPTPLWRAGLKNSVDYRLTRHRVERHNLPPAFDGYRILHLSDLHIDGIHDACGKLNGLVGELEADLCVITGDFRYKNHGSHGEVEKRMEELLSRIRCADGVIGVLGNHDSFSMVPAFERMGMRFLINESIEITRGGQSVWIAGVDDPHYFGLHDIARAMTGVPRDAFKVFLAHSPDIVEHAAGAGADLYLCGHSHGGQICLPGEVPVMANLKCSRRYFRGPWRKAHMHGYTSRGAGNSGVPLRFHSRPEVIVHHLLTPRRG